MSEQDKPVRVKVAGVEKTMTWAEINALPRAEQEQVAVWNERNGWVRPFRFQDTGEWLRPADER